jgi:ATP-dependent DNA helicase RecG
VRAILFAHRPFAKMDKDSRVHACYLHACLRHVMRDPMTNTSLRERFGIDPKNSAIASRIIRDAQDAGLIKPYGDARGKHGSYVPFWA